MKSIRLTVRNPGGIHLRPMVKFVQTAGARQFKATRVTVRNLTLDGPAKDAKSAVLVPSLKIKQGHEIEVAADGPDEDEVLEAVRLAVESGLGEKIE